MCGAKNLHFTFCVFYENMGRGHDQGKETNLACQFGNGIIVMPSAVSLHSNVEPTQTVCNFGCIDGL